MPDANEISNDQTDVAMHEADDGDAVCGSDELTDMSIMLGNEYDDFPPLRRCRFCGLCITRAWSELKEHGDLVDNSDAYKSIKKSRVTSGAESGCRDCHLLSITMGLLDLYDCLVRTSTVLIDGDVKALYVEVNNLDSTFSLFQLEDPDVHDAQVETQWSKISKLSNCFQQTSYDTMYARIRNWMHECYEGHIDCMKNTMVKLPKRILEIVDDKVFLREQNIEGTYACLSHCWGNRGPAMQLTQESMILFKSGLARCQLPKTFRDAADICSNLSISYLWIDALCIMQNDEDDWRDAVSTMASIYENAYITIAATASNGSEGGCFQSTLGQREVHKLGNTGLFAVKLPPRFPAESTFPREPNVIDWPLLTRGWVCQERRLSSRVIHFAKHQLVWECDTVTRSEDFDEGWEIESNLTILGNTVKALSLDSKSGWKNFVETYSVLKFTKTTDRLPALAGIVVKEMRRRGDDVYVAGMWKSSLLDDLASYSDKRDPCAPGIPTWSWASYPGRILWMDPLAKRSAELLHLDYACDGPAQMGTVHGACIRIRGPTLSISCGSFQPHEHRVYLMQNEIFSCYVESYGAVYRFGNDDKLLALLLSTEYQDPGPKFDVVGIAILLQETTTGRFEKFGTVEVCLERHIESNDGNQDAALEAFLDLVTVREVEIV